MTAQVTVDELASDCRTPKTDDSPPQPDAHNTKAPSSHVSYPTTGDTPQPGS